MLPGWERVIGVALLHHETSLFCVMACPTLPAKKRTALLQDTGSHWDKLLAKTIPHAATPKKRRKKPKPNNIHLQQTQLHHCYHKGLSTARIAGLCCLFRIRFRNVFETFAFQLPRRAFKSKELSLKEIRTPQEDCLLALG